MDNKQITLKYISESINDSKLDVKKSYFIKGQMDMALKLEVITQEEYDTLCSNVLEYWGLKVVSSVKIYRTDNLYYNGYLVLNEHGYYDIVVDTDYIAEMEFYDYEFISIDDMNGWTLLAKEDIPNYDLYSDGKFVDFGVLNGVYDESYK